MIASHAQCLKPSARVQPVNRRLVIKPAIDIRIPQNCLNVIASLRKRHGLNELRRLPKSPHVSHARARVRPASYAAKAASVRPIYLRRERLQVERPEFQVHTRLKQGSRRKDSLSSAGRLSSLPVAGMICVSPRAFARDTAVGSN